MKLKKIILTSIVAIAILTAAFYIIANVGEKEIQAASGDEYIYCDPSTKTTTHIYGNGTGGTQNSVCTLCGFTCDGLNKTEKALFEEDLAKCTTDAEKIALISERVITHDNNSHTIRCRYCNATHSYDHIKTLDTSEGKTGTEATCTTGGSGDWICTICGETGNGTWPATGHVWYGGHAYGNTNPTCTEPGEKLYWQCSKCGKRFNDNKGTTELSSDDIVKPALGHDMEEVAARNATCTEDGNSHYYKCKRCGKYFSDQAGNTEITNKASVIIPAPGHTYTIVNGKEATCKNTGSTVGVKCSVCDEVFVEQREIQTTNHKWGEWTVKTKTSDKIVEERVCSVCSKTEKREIEIIKDHTHDWKDWVITKAATCAEKGSRKRECNGCTETQTEEIPATGNHKWGEWEITEPTCTKEGKAERTCSVCEKVEAVIIPMIEHVKVIKYNEKEHWEICVSCETEAEDTREEHKFGDDNICDVCGYKFEVEKPKEEPKPEEIKEEKQEEKSDKELPDTGRTTIVVAILAGITLAGVGALKLKKYKGV